MYAGIQLKPGNQDDSAEKQDHDDDKKYLEKFFHFRYF
jgi:hypothetical protein